MMISVLSPKLSRRDSFFVTPCDLSQKPFQNQFNMNFDRVSVKERAIRDNIFSNNITLVSVKERAIRAIRATVFKNFCSEYP